MIITEFPIELQEKILGNVKDNTRLNLVCTLWNEICKKDIIKDLRVPCICNKSVFHAMKCKQNTDLSHAKTLRLQFSSLIENYFDKKAKANLKELFRN